MDSSNADTTVTPLPITVGGHQVHEHGPLASLASVLDVGARRVLPGHLLRRSRVLSSLHIDSRTFQQRISLTARSGEVSVFKCTLHCGGEAEDGGEEINTSNHHHHHHHHHHLVEKETMKTWKLHRVQRESPNFNNTNNNTNANEENSSSSFSPTTPQPKAAPEAVIHAQIHALQRGNIFEASSFNSWQPSESFASLTSKQGGERPGDGFSMGINFDLLQHALNAYPYSALLKHEGVVLGPAALPTQHSMLQEVWIKSNNNNEWCRFVWTMNLQSETACWMCTEIAVVVPSAAN